MAPCTVSYGISTPASICGASDSTGSWTANPTTGGSQAPRYGVQIENSLSFHEDGLLLDQDRKTGFGHAKIMHYVAECNLLSPTGIFSAVARQIPVHGKRLPAGQKEFKGKQVTHGDLGAV